MKQIHLASAESPGTSLINLKCGLGIFDFFFFFFPFSTPFCSHSPNPGSGLTLTRRCSCVCWLPRARRPQFGGSSSGHIGASWGPDCHPRVCLGHPAGETCPGQISAIAWGSLARIPLPSTGFIYLWPVFIYQHLPLSLQGFGGAAKAIKTQLR